MVLEADYSKQQSNLISNHSNMLLEIEKIKKEHLDRCGYLELMQLQVSLNVSYSKLMNGLNNKNIMIDRKILSDIAIHDSSTFKKIVQSAVK